MKYFERLREASTAAGAALVLDGLFGLAANVGDPLAWGKIIGGVMAIIRPEGKAA